MPTPPVVPPKTNALPRGKRGPKPRVIAVQRDLLETREALEMLTDALLALSLDAPPAEPAAVRAYVSVKAARDHACRVLGWPMP